VIDDVLGALGVQMEKLTQRQLSSTKVSGAKMRAERFEAG
jgi:hypothetical protein